MFLEWEILYFLSKVGEEYFKDFFPDRESIFKSFTFSVDLRIVDYEIRQELIETFKSFLVSSQKRQILSEIHPS